MAKKQEEEKEKCALILPMIGVLWNLEVSRNNFMEHSVFEL